jgi:hypothetical protein
MTAGCQASRQQLLTPKPRRCKDPTAAYKDADGIEALCQRRSLCLETDLEELDLQAGRTAGRQTGMQQRVGAELQQR